MAFYKVTFTIDGTRHFTTGTSSYPTIEQIRNNDWLHDVAMTNAGMFIAGYKEVKGIDNDKKAYDISYEIYENQSFL